MITIPEAARLHLLGFHQRVELAKRELQITTDTTLAMLGLDPSLHHHLDLDTGVVTPAADKEKPQ